MKPIYGIWCLDTSDWLRESRGEAILAFTTKAAACRRAASNYGYYDYTDAKRDGWVEVRSLALIDTLTRGKSA